MEHLILRCADGIPEELLLQKGLCKELRRRLSAVLGVDISKPGMEPLLSKLGKAKYELYTPGAKFSRRKARAGPGDEPGPEVDPDPAASRLDLAVADFLRGDNLSARIEWKVEDWLSGISETDSVWSEDPSGPAGPEQEPAP